MGAPDHDRLSELFAEAARLPPGKRPAFLDRACGADTALRAELELLLAHDDDVAPILRTGALGPVVDDLLEATPERIGPYVIVEKLAEGGMGIVYRAEQQEPIRRQVALKLIKPGIESRQVIARFESERQALALMNHPNIAAVLDAGVTRNGRPYFAMELVEGQPLTTFCDRQRLSIRERLELFIQVCDAVQHAHQKTIIHRDLKPSNILVDCRSGKPIPKVIDFGVAKAMQQNLTDRSLHTEIGALMGTPDYMSPEQADPGHRDIDTRTDVYSLGVVLYELLVGVRPHDSDDGNRASVDEIRQRIRDEEPRRPSTRLLPVNETSARAARRRSSDPRALSRYLGGDPDWIVMRALERSPERRYASPSELAADVSRHLRNEPVVACPPSRRYRAGKFIRKHRVGTIFTGAIALLITASVTAMGLLVVQNRRERDTARHEAAVATESLDFVTEMLGLANSGNRTLLDAAGTRISEEYADQPVVQARLETTLARSYDRLSLHTEARELLERALPKLRAGLGDDHPYTLECLHTLAVRVQDPERAERLWTEVIDGWLDRLGADSREVLSAKTELGRVYVQHSRFDEAARLLQDAQATLHRTLGDDDPATLQADAFLTVALLGQGKHRDAVDLARDAIPEMRRVLGRQAHTTVAALYNLACAAAVVGDRDLAIESLRESVEWGFDYARELAPQDPDLASLADDPEFKAIIGWDGYTEPLGQSRRAATAGRTEDAISQLKLAVERGFANRVLLESDDRFRSLHDDPDFEAILAALEDGGTD